MKPLTSNLRIDQRLTNVSHMITNAEYIHDKVLPTVGVVRKTGNIAKYGKDHLRIFDGRRSGKDVGAHVIEWSIDTDLTYQIENHDHDFPITDMDYDDYESPFEAQADATMFLKTVKDQRMEATLANKLSDATVLTNTATPSTLWDVATSDPLGDMETAAEAVRVKVGRRPNYIVTNSVVISKLKEHPQFLNRINGVQKNMSTADVIDIIKNHLGGIVDVFVGSAIYETTVEGQTSSLGDIWSDDFLLFWRPQTGSLRVPSFGYRFALKSSKVQEGIYKYRNGTETADMIRIAYQYQDKILDVNASYLLDQVIS